VKNLKMKKIVAKIVGAEKETEKRLDNKEG
jgi:ABC-type Fe3+-citrate transport system substrate-binding protein